MGKLTKKLTRQQWLPAWQLGYLKEILFFKEVLFKRFASLFASINIHCVCRILVPVKLMSTETTPSWCPSKLNLGSSFSSFLQLCNHSQMIFLNSSLSAKIIVGILILLLNENKLRRRKLDRFLEVWISCTFPLQYHNVTLR